MRDLHAKCRYSYNGWPDAPYFRSLWQASQYVCNAFTACLVLNVLLFYQHWAFITSRQFASQAFIFSVNESKQKQISITLCDVRNDFWHSLPAFWSTEAALLLVSTKSSAASGDENVFPVAELSFYSACSSGRNSVWQIQEYVYCDGCPVHHIWISYFVISMIYELSSARV